jgi:hypothetical protein
MMMLLRLTLLAVLLCIVSAESLRGASTSVEEDQHGRMLAGETATDIPCTCPCRTKDRRAGHFMIASMDTTEFDIGAYFCQRDDRLQILLDGGMADCARDCHIRV